MELLEQLQKNLNSLISIHFFKQLSGDSQKTAEASYSMYLKSVKELTTTYEFHLSNGQDNAGKSDMTVSFPKDAQFTAENESTQIITYKKNDTTYSIKLLFTSKVPTAKPIKTQESSSIREIRNKEGKLEKILIDIPDTGVNIDFLSKVESLLVQLLSHWKTFELLTDDEVASSMGLTFTYNSVETIRLPGNTFFEIQATSEKGTTSIEVSPSMTINLLESSITFQLEDFSYTIKHKL